MTCYFCNKRGKTWEGSDPICAFPDGRFTHYNWKCATMNCLRNIAGELGVYYRDDMAAASFGAIPFEVDREQKPNQGYIVMTWYKSRGETGNALVMADDEPIYELDSELARLVIKNYERQEL